jgi:proteasome regulatory subunit
MDSYVKNLEKRLRNLETEKQLLDAERLRLEQELHSLRNEIDRLREPPLLGAVVVSILEQEKPRVVVATSNGPFLVVNLSRRVKDKKIGPGTIVALNQRTYAIMEVLPITSEELKEAKELIFLTELKLKKDDNLTK